jgi:hypothetical protein
MWTENRVRLKALLAAREARDDQRRCWRRAKRVTTKSPGTPGRFTIASSRSCRCASKRACS